MTHTVVNVTGGATPSEFAALTAALSAVLNEHAVPVDPAPAIYRSRWRRRAIADAVTRDESDGWGMAQ